ncbi:MAG: hypothetical protein ACC662_05005, partial [Planctomycetota bacterium]
LRSLDERFVLHVFAFAADWWSLGAAPEEGAGPTSEPKGPRERVASIADAIRALEPGERAQGGTNLGGVLQSVAREFLDREDRRLAGVLLISDGRDTSKDTSPREILASMGSTREDLHVTPVALGNAASGRNVRVEPIRALDVVLVGDDVVFETALHHRGFTGLPGVRTQLEIEKIADAEGKPLPPKPYDPGKHAIREEGPLRLGTEDDATPVHLQARMNEAGTFRVHVKVVLPPEAAAEDAIRTDNEAIHEIRVKDERIKILFVDDLPRYELRFLANWLTREPQADPANPEMRRRYETHVLQQSADPSVDPPRSPGLPRLRRFPSTRAELFEYDVIILGDVDWQSLAPSIGASRRILGLIRDFVREGGGLALEAGANFRDPLDFRDTPLQDLLPIHTRKTDENASRMLERPFRLRLTEVGRRHPIFGIVPGLDGKVASPAEVAAAWAGERAFSQDWAWYWLYRARGGLKPGAVDLAVAVPEGGPASRDFLDEVGRPLVVFATMAYGKGRVFFSALDSIWRIRRGYGDRYYGPFWDQIVRYLATYRLLMGNRRYKISSDKARYYVGETAVLTITALDRDFAPLEDPYLDGVHIEDPRGNDLLLESERRPVNQAAEGAAPGTYRIWIPIRQEGTWRVWISDLQTPGAAARGDGGRAELRFKADYESAELRITIPDHDLLAEIARLTNGRLLDGRPASIDRLAEVAKEIPPRKVRRVLDRQGRTQWDRWWVLVLLVALLGLEWIVRKRWQMI